MKNLNLKNLTETKACYESDSFVESYYVVLEEVLLDFGVENLMITAENDWELFENRPVGIDEKTATKVIEYVKNNITDYVKQYQHYYVGYNNIASVDFGEQQVELEYPMNEDDDDCGFYIGDDEYAYYDMTGYGVQVVLKQNDVYAILDAMKETE